MSTQPYLVREILEYSDGTRKIVNFNPLPMSDDEQKVAEPAPEEEAPVEAEASAEAPLEVPASEETASVESPSA